MCSLVVHPTAEEENAEDLLRTDSSFGGALVVLPLQFLQLGAWLPEAEQCKETCLDGEVVLGCRLKSCQPELQFLMWNQVKRPVAASTYAVSVSSINAWRWMGDAQL